MASSCGFSSVQFIHSVVPDSLRPHGLQHTRPPCPSPTPGIHLNSHLSSQWWHPTISSSGVHFFSYLQSFPATGSFPVSQFFSLGGQSIGFSFSISPSNEYSGLIPFSMDLLDLLAVQGTLKSLLQHHSSKASTLQCSAFITVQFSYPYMTTGKTIALTRRSFVGKLTSLLLNMLSRLVIFNSRRWLRPWLHHRLTERSWISQLTTYTIYLPWVEGDHSSGKGHCWFPQHWLHLFPSW